jgi:hypothetical protein
VFRIASKTDEDAIALNSTRLRVEVILLPTFHIIVRFGDGHVVVRGFLALDPSV